MRRSRRGARDGLNVQYLLRKARLVRCRNGLVKRPVADLLVRMAGEPDPTTRGDRLLVEGGLRFGDAKQPEVEILVLPGSGRFSGPRNTICWWRSPAAGGLARRPGRRFAGRPVASQRVARTHDVSARRIRPSTRRCRLTDGWSLCDSKKRAPRRLMFEEKTEPCHRAGGSPVLFLRATELRFRCALTDFLPQRTGKKKIFRAQPGALRASAVKLFRSSFFVAAVRGEMPFGMF